MKLRSTAVGVALASVLMCAPPATASITNAQLFQWAQITYPALFPGTPQAFPVVYQGKTFDVRAYANGNYLGVAEGRAYGLGSFTGGALQDFGDMQALAAQVCAAVICSAPDPQGGSVNECMLPASQQLAPGLRILTTYVATGGQVTGLNETVSEHVVDGAASFNGQSAIKSTARVQMLKDGVLMMSQVNRYFDQVADGGLKRSLGMEIDTTLGGRTTSVRVTNEPAQLNSEFALGAGQSLTRTESGTTLGISPPSPATTSSTTKTYVFEARETITVQGRSYDTCRYRNVNVGYPDENVTWHIVGKGVTAMQEFRRSGVATSRSELKSGSINGVPL